MPESIFNKIPSNIDQHSHSELVQYLDKGEQADRGFFMGACGLILTAGGLLVRSSILTELGLVVTAAGFGGQLTSRSSNFVAEQSAYMRHETYGSHSDSLEAN